MRKHKQSIIDDTEGEKKEQSSMTRRKRISKRKNSKNESILGNRQTEEQFPIQFVQLENTNHNCPICLDLLAKSVTTACGHSYCEYCLNEYLIFFEQCLQCGKNLRNHNYSYNRVLDEIVQAIVPTMEMERILEYNERYQKNKEYILNKKVEVFNVGDIIDVRDRDYVWCKARIYRTISRRSLENRIKILFVNYIGKDKKDDQQIAQNSDRLATAGFYTSRKDILQYQQGANGQLKIKSPLQMTTDSGEVLLVEGSDSYQQQ